VIRARASVAIAIAAWALVVPGCAGTPTPMAKPPDRYERPPTQFNGYSWELTGPRWASVSIDRTATELHVQSPSPNAPWNGEVRLRAVAVSLGGRVALRCQVYPVAGGPARELVLTFDGAPALDSPLLLEDHARGRWATLALEGAALVLRDADGRVRLSVTRLGPDEHLPDGTLPLVVGGRAALLVRALDAHGLPASAGTALQP
jgi:hypothetical protein